MDGQISNSGVTVSGGTLSGNGVLGGPVVVQTGARLMPGDSVGQLTINNSLQLDAGSTTVMELNTAAGTNDSIVGLTSISYGGTLVVTNVGGTLSAGDSFPLFVASPGTYGGAFDTIILPTLTGALRWDTNGLPVDGTIKVVATGAKINSVVIVGTALVLSGTGGPTNGTYYVLASTNIASPLSNWTSIATQSFGADGSFQFTTGLVGGIPKRFYALQVP